MKIRTLIGAAAALCTLAGAAMAQPANDNCGSAIAVSIPSTTTGTTVGATIEAGPPQTCTTSYSAPGVWYTLVGDGTTLTTSLCVGTAYDSKLHVYCSTNATPCDVVTALSCVGGNDDGCGSQSTVTFCSALGQTYYVLVSGFSATTGAFTLTVSSNATACSTAVACGGTTAGACCNNTTQACTITATAAACSTGAFQGIGTSCTFTSPCPGVGACCSSTGTCTVVLPANCSGTSSHQGVGTTCLPTNPCTALLRACCSSSGACSLTLPSGCAGATQTFLAANTTCTPTNPCTALLGACCSSTGSTCTNTTTNGCASPSTFGGVASTCAVFCPTGACCNGTTCTVTGPTGCAFAYQGNGTTCSPNLCQGACCTTGASPVCTLTTAAGCANSFKGLGSTCSPTPCPNTASPVNDECPAAIVIPNGTLPAIAIGTNAVASTDPSAAVCASSFRDVWYTFTSPATQQYSVRTCGGVSGSLDTVVSVHTACPSAGINRLITVVGIGDPCPTTLNCSCNDDNCSGVGPSQIPSVRLDSGVTYWIRVAMFGTSLAGGPFTLTIDAITGTCCSATDGSCSITTQAGCGSGTWTFGGTCTTTTCPGACCNADGTCVALASVSGCVGYQGAGTICANVTCPIPNGACCDTAGLCTIQDGTNCLAPNVFQGDATTCTPDPCAALIGACCASTGLCSSSIASGCTGGATFQGTGTSCTPNPCPQPPDNDLCDNATNASLGDNPGTCVAANADGAAGCGSTGGRDVFFKFFPAVTGNYRIKTCNSATVWDTVVSVHTACPATSANQLAGACSDDFSTEPDGNCGGVGLSRISTITLTQTGGDLYFIRVAGFSSATTPDAFILTIELLNPTGACCIGSCCTVTEQAACTGTWGPANSTCSPNPCTVSANDNCANAVVISNVSLPVTVTGDNCNATADGPAGLCGGTANSVWWSFTPTHTAAYSINNCGGSFDSVISVFSNDCVTPVEVDCNDDTCGLQSTVAGVVLIAAGQPYLIRVGSFSTGVGAISLTVSADAALGSCCATDGSCSLTDLANCTGAFTDAGTCTPNICPQPTGACCCGASCSITLPGDCVGTNKVFSGSGSTCLPYSATVPCCRGNFNKSAPGPGAPGGVSVQDIFDFLAAYFATDACANANDSVPSMSAPNGISVQDIFDFLAAYFGGCP